MADLKKPVACACKGEREAYMNASRGEHWVDCISCGVAGAKRPTQTNAIYWWNKMQRAIRSHSALVEALDACADADCTGDNIGCSGGGDCAGCDTGEASCNAQKVLAEIRSR